MDKRLGAVAIFGGVLMGLGGAIPVPILGLVGFVTLIGSIVAGFFVSESDE
jgi:hypothetical protein